MPRPIDAILSASADKVKSSGMIEQNIRMGVVSAVATDGTITVTAAGSTFPRVRLLQSVQAPDVGDSVEIANTLGGWVCIGALRTTKAPKIQTGYVDVTSSTANSWSASVAVTFPVPFESTPKVVATINGGGPTGSAQLGWVCSDVTATGFNIRQIRGTTATGSYAWIATTY